MPLVLFFPQVDVTLVGEFRARAIFTAASKAQQAIDWLFQRDLKIQEAAA